MDNILYRIHQADKKHNFFSERNLSEVCCLVALSGGADSVCLLIALSELGINVRAVHINHLLRGDESLRDEEFCRKLCCKKGIELNVRRYNVSEIAKQFGMGIEETARKVRYEAFEELLAPGELLATAHTASDNLETVVHNFARGTGLKGLLGIPPVRKTGNSFQPAMIIRPLIYAVRKEILEYLSERKQDYVTDSTNFIPDYTRNKIRLGIIPKLTELNPNLYAVLSRTVDVLGAENDFLDEQADLAYGKCISADGTEINGLNCYHKAIRRRCIIKLLGCIEVPYSSDRVEQIDAVLFGGGKINIAKGVYIEGNMGKIIVIKKA